LRIIRPTQKLTRGNDKTEQFGKKETISVEDVVVSQSYEIAAILSVLEKKGLRTREEVIEEIKRLRA
jgi:hypothetical protein